MGLVAFTHLDGSTVELNTDFCSGLTSVPASLLPVGVPAGVYYDQPGLAPTPIQGTLAAIAAIVGAGTSVPFGFERYTPTFTASGGGVVALIGEFAAIRIGQVVQLVGSLSFTPAVPGVLETVKFSLPTGTGIAPPVAFGSASDLYGPATSNVNADVLSSARAFTGSPVAGAIDVTAAATSEIALSVSYKPQP